MRESLNVGRDGALITDPNGTDPIIGVTVGFFAGAYYGALGAALTPGANLVSIAAGAGAGGVIGGFIGALDPSLGLGTLAVIGGVAGGAGDIAGQLAANYASGNRLGGSSWPCPSRKRV
jgi:hypothetical protein